ncbi:MAG: hypothetical protein AAGJ46_21170 [Planctomycetota bacterium]
MTTYQDGSDWDIAANEDNRTADERLRDQLIYRAKHIAELAEGIADPSKASPEWAAELFGQVDPIRAIREQLSAALHDIDQHLAK